MNELKVCSKCGNTKDVSEFNRSGFKNDGSINYHSQCKVCSWFDKHKDLIIRETWSLGEYFTVIDHILNQKMETINELLDILNNKTLEELCFMVSDLGIKGKNIKIKQKCSNSNCNNIVIDSPYRLIHSKHSAMCCSVECQKEWQKQYLVGENANTYDKAYAKEDRIRVCETCGKEFENKSGRLKHEIVRFCSSECRKDWFFNKYIKTESFRNKARKNALRILSEGLIPNTLTIPHRKITELLEHNNIEFENEKTYEYFSIDIFLKEYGLPIEINGTFWHADTRFNKNIKYEQQLNRIKSDKAKHSYILNNYGVEILYLWEDDILNNIEICRELINLYIINKGILEDYHSCNYVMANDTIVLKDKLIKQYMYFDRNDLLQRVNISMRQKISKKQEDKWIKFNCEYCGKECKELISHYKKKNSHCCSTKCSGSLRRTNNSVKVKCNSCGKEIYVNNSIYKKSKTKKFNCNIDCKYKKGEC